MRVDGWRGTRGRNELDIPCQWYVEYIGNGRYLEIGIQEELLRAQGM